MRGLADKAFWWCVRTFLYLVVTLPVLPVLALAVHFSFADPDVTRLIWRTEWLLCACVMLTVKVGSVLLVIRWLLYGGVGGMRNTPAAE